MLPVGARQFAGGDGAVHGGRKVFRQGDAGQDVVHHEAAETVGSVRAHEAVGAEVIGRVPAEFQAAALPCLVGRIAHGKRLRHRRLPFHGTEVIRGTRMEIPCPDKAVQDLREVLPIGRFPILDRIQDLSGRALGDHLETVLGPRQGHVEDVDTVNHLHFPFPAVVLGKEGFFGRTAQFHVINAIGHIGDGFPVHIGTAPVGRGFEEGDFLRKREDDVRELQSLGLMDSHHPHRGAGIRRGDLGIRPFPVPEESGEVIAPRSRPVQEEVHEGLDIGNLRIEGIRFCVPKAAQERFRQFGERVVVVRKLDFHLPGEVARDGSPVRRVGAVYQGELGHEPAHRHGGFHKQGIVRNDRDALGHQPGGDFGPFGIAADQDGDVPIPGARLPDLPDRVQDRLQFRLVVVTEQHVHGALGLFVGADFLLDIGIDPADIVPAQQAVQLLRRIREELVVELHDGPAGTVIPVQYARGVLRQAEVPLQAAVQQFPVRSPPAVDGLFHIPHDEVVEAARLAVPEQRPEVLPLDGRGVLELVQQEILEPDTQLLIDEGRIGAVDDILEDGIGVVDTDDILLPLDLLEGLPEFPGDAEPIDLAPDQERGPILLVTVFEQVAERLQGPFQAAFQLHPELVLGLGEPLGGIRRILLESGRGRYYGVPRTQCLIPVELFHEAAVRFGRVDAVPGEHIQDRIGSHFYRRLIVLYQNIAALADRGEMLLGIDFSFVDTEAADGLLVVPRLEVHGHLLEGRLQVEPVALLQAGLYVVREPVQKTPVGLCKPVQDAVHALLHKRGLVQLHLVGGELADLTGKGPERLLEELVDGGDGKGRIVVQDAAQLPRSPLLERSRVREQGRDEIRIVGRLLRLGRKGMQFLEDTLFHLVRGLVRKGHGEDVPIGLRVLFHQQQADIFTGQVVGLSRPGRSFQDLDHRPQIILKSQ